MIGNKRLWVKAYLDTGNRLYDDTTNMPVCIIEKDTIEILKSQLILHKIRVKTVSNDTEYLEIFEVSKLKIYDRKEGDKKLENVLFAIANHTLDQNNQFHALLHPDILFS